ncbi:MAG: hypothetical protein ACK45H_11560 [Bacteroidota bacterium]
MRFVSDISLWWFLPMLAVSVIAAIWYYRNVNWLNDQSVWLRRLMVGLRTLVLFFVLVLLLGLVLEHSSYREEKPVVITLVDNSGSMLNYKDSAKVLQRVKAYKTQLKERYGDRFELLDMITGFNAKYGSDLDFKDARTDLSAGFEKIREDFYNRNIGGIVLISDGNFNNGPNPLYAAERIGLTPVFSLLTGDTVRKKDQYIKNISVNDVAFLKNEFPVEVDLEAIKLGKRSVNVSIYRDGKKLAEQKVNYSGNSVDFQHASFQLTADKIGFNAYTVVVSDVENEISYANNKRTFYLEVIDSRSRVLLLAGAPHPDIAAIRQVLETDENLQVEAYSMRDWDGELKNVDLVVVHEPGSAEPLEKLMKQRIPVLFVLGPNAVASAVKDLSIGLNLPANRQTDENQVYLNKGFAQFELSDELRRSMEFYPPLKSRFGDLNVSGAEVLAYQRVGNVQKKDPAIFFLKSGGVRYGVIYGEGVWKWKMNDFERTGTFSAFEDLVSKMAQYLLVKQNNAQLRIDVPKRMVKNEEVIINASFYNASMEPVSDATIDLELLNEKGKKSRFRLGASGNTYRTSLGRLEPGKYEWKCVATHDGKKHVRSGVFIVEDIDPESLANHADISVLNQLASATGGKVFPLQEYERLLDELSARGDITTMSYRESSFDGLIDFKFLFFLLLLLLAAEWFLRRWLGAY